MPTQNPRITITLEPTQALLLRDISKLTKQSQSALIGELLRELAPVWGKMRDVLAAAEEVKKNLNETIVRDMDEAQSRIEKQLGLCLDELDGMQAPLVELAEKIKRRKGRGDGTPRGDAPAPRAAASTPLSNRGVRSKPNSTKSTTYEKTAPNLKYKNEGGKNGQI